MVVLQRRIGGWRDEALLPERKHHNNEHGSISTRGEEMSETKYNKNAQTETLRIHIHNLMLSF